MQAGLRAVLGAAGKGCGQNPALPVFLFTGLISLLKTKTKKTSGIKADTHTYSERETGGSCTPHWPLNNYVTEHDLKLLTLRPLSSKCWAFSGVHPYTWFMWCIDQTYSSYMLVKLFTSWATSLVPCLKDFRKDLSTHSITLPWWRKVIPTTLMTRVAIVSVTVNTSVWNTFFS